MPQLRIFSYLPNPRLFKSTVTAHLNGVELDIRGGTPQELTDWLWDFDAHPMDQSERDDTSTLRVSSKGFQGHLHKTDDFLHANPFGTVPTAFSPDGEVGIFESNSIMRAVARLGEQQKALYGNDVYTAARIDAFLDTSLVFALESQRYIFALAGKGALVEGHARMSTAFDVYLNGIEVALSEGHRFIVGSNMTLADICFACELILFSLERHESAQLDQVGLAPIWTSSQAADYSRAHRHFEQLLDHPAFAPDAKPYYEQMTLGAIFS